MSFEFRDAVRADANLLILLAGSSGSGKTESALRLATGIANGGLIVGIDTERCRMLHKADDYTFKHAEFEPPYTPERYVEAIEAAEKLNPAVILIDSGSHEYDGEGGLLDMQEEELARLGGGENVKLLSWSKPKQRHRRYRNALVRAKPHLIVCHRADDKVEIVKENGKTKIVPKQSFTGAQGFVPICEKRLPYEATISLLVTVANPGVPIPIKLESRHAELVPLDRQLSEETGAQLAAWAAGKTGVAAQGSATADDETQSGNGATGTGGDAGNAYADEEYVAAFLEFVKTRGAENLKTAEDALAAHRKKNDGRVRADWLATIRERLEAVAPEPVEETLPI